MARAIVAMSTDRKATTIAIKSIKMAPRNGLQDELCFGFVVSLVSEVVLCSLPVSMLSETESISTSSIIASTGSIISSSQGASASASSTLSSPSWASFDSWAFLEELSSTTSSILSSKLGTSPCFASSESDSSIYFISPLFCFQF